MNIRTIMLVGGLFSATTLLASGQNAPTVKPSDSHSNAVAAAACPSPASANAAANRDQESSSQVKEAKKANSQSQHQTVNDPSANDQPIDTQKADSNKSPWWEPRDWNYIESF